MTIVYRNGLLPPIEGADLVRLQIRLAHEYGNALIEIERERRRAVRALVSGFGTVGLAEAEARAADDRAAAAASAIRAYKADGRTATVPEPLVVELQTARKAQTVAFESLRGLRASAMEELASEIAAVGEVAAAAQRQKRGEFSDRGLAWGTYLLVERAHDARRKKALYDWIEPADPHFSRFEGEGSIAIHVQGALLTTDEVSEGSSRWVRIEPGRAPTGLKAGSRRSRRQYGTLALRIGSDGIDPVWARFPICLHRPLPPGAKVTWVAVTLRKIGPREEWYCCFTVEQERSVGCAASNGSADGHSVGVDIGWRVLPDGVRVAAWVGSDGRRGQLVLNARLLGGFAKVTDLQAIRSDLLRHAIEELLAVRNSLEVPPWFAEATASLHHWKSQARLAGLCRRWRDNRFLGDKVAYEALERWRYRDHHLWAWEASQRQTSLRARREVYRIFAAKLAAEYRTVVLERFDLRRVARSAPVEEAEENRTARRNRVVAAVSELREVLVSKFRSRGGAAIGVEAALTTRLCHVCGSEENWDQASEVEHVCGTCGEKWDQDDNAADNILSRESSGDEWGTGGARGRRKRSNGGLPGESKWARVKRLKAERRVDGVGARSAASNDARRRGK